MDIEIIPDSKIVDWEFFDQSGIKFVCCIVSDKNIFLSSKKPKISGNQWISIEGAAFCIISGETMTNGSNDLTPKEIHLRPNPKLLSDIHKSIGISQGEPA